MGNRWIDCNELLCAQYKSILYVLSKGAGSYSVFDKIDNEFKENRCSETLNDWLKTSSQHLKILVMDAKHNKWIRHTRRKTASEPILLWAEILKSYLAFKHDTPSCVQLWRWAINGHREQKQTERELAHLNIRMIDNKLYIGASYSTSKKTYDKLFERHIGTQSIYPEAKQRKHEKFMQEWERHMKKKFK